MLIRRLVELADRLDLPPTGYSEAPIHWVIDLNGQGRMISTLRKMETEYTDKKGNTKTKHGASMLIPYRARSGRAIRPMLMADQGEYALGFIREKNRGSEGRGSMPSNAMSLLSSWLRSVLQIRMNRTWELWSLILKQPGCLEDRIPGRF